MSLATELQDDADEQDFQHRSLPRLLPAAQQAAALEPTGPRSSTSPTTTTLSPRARRTHVVPAACEACRKRKSKCSAQRPRCRACVQRDTECQYTTASEETHNQALKRKYDELQIRHKTQTPFEELFSLLQRKPEHESLEVYQRIRSGSDIESVLRHVKDGDLLMQLSIVPEAFRQYSFPHHPEMPAFILRTKNQYLESVIYDATIVGHPITTQPAVIRYAQNVPYLCPYLKPYGAASMVDELLVQVEVSNWTRALSQERILKRLLHDYLLYQHSWTAFFHKDHFLEDMRSGSSRFCSQLLVNAVLASACHIARDVRHKAHFWDPSNLGYRFLAEAKRLWEIESSQRPTRLTTIQAGLLLSAISNYNGADQIGTLYLAQTIRMAGEEDLLQPAADVKDKQLRHSRALTAWSLFAWQSFHCYHFLRMPWLTQPPAFALPEPDEEHIYYGEIRVSYPPSPLVHSLHLGQVIKANFNFCTILNSLSCVLFCDDAVQLTALRVREYKARLDEWYHEMPDSLSPLKLTYPDHILLHMEYHGAVIKLLELHAPPEYSPNASPLSPADRALRTSITASEIRLETLLRLYYLRHSFDDYSPRLMNWLIFLGNLAVERLRIRALSSSSSDDDNSASHAASEPTTRALRSTLILCAQGLYCQGKNYQLAVPVFRVLRDRMAPADVVLLRTFISAKDDDQIDGEQLLMPQYLQSQWPVPIIRLDQDPRLANLEKLSGKHRKMSMGTVASEYE